MHELSIAQDIVETVKRYLPPGEMRSVKSVKLEIGHLTRITLDPLRFCFELAGRGTAVEGADLEIQQVSGDEIRVVEVEVEEKAPQ